MTKKKYETPSKKEPINASQHKVFKIPELFIAIIENVEEHEETKQSVITGQTYSEKERMSKVYRKITHVCKTWNIMWRKELIRKEYEENRVYNMNFCNICDRYEPEICENTPRHHNYWEYNDKGKQIVKFVSGHRIIEWECKKKCMIHCAKEFEHCRNGKKAGYVKKTLSEYAAWRKNQIEG